MPRTTIPELARKSVRGPRTPNERARDAARSAATLLERTADDELRAVATMLRFEYEGKWNEPGRIEAAAAARILLHTNWSFVRELNAHRLVDEVRERIDALEALAAKIQPPERPTLELVKGGDDG